MYGFRRRRSHGRKETLLCHNVAVLYVIRLKPQMPLSHPTTTASTATSVVLQVGVQSLSKTSSLAPGVRQLRPVIYYMAFPLSALSHSNFALPQSPWPLRLQPKVVFLTPQIVGLLLPT